MTDRAFAVALLALAAGYGYVSLKLHAPFQYDPLGPESWPRLLAATLALAAIAMFRRPDPEPEWHGLSTLRRVALSAALLVGYALLFEPLGFIASTTLFCVLTSRCLGAKLGISLAVGLGCGIVGYFLCTRVLALNLPAGIMPF